MEKINRYTAGSSDKPLPFFQDRNGNKVFPAEYMVVLQPHEELYKRIVKLKEEFSESFDNSMAVALKPHIALVRFRQYEMKEQPVYQRLKLLAMSLPAFKIDLDGFGSYPSHTIFLKVVTQEPVKAIAKKLREAQSLMRISNEHRPLFMNEPHIAIARKLLPWQYEKGWQQYAGSPFHGSFVASKLLFLKRRQGSKAWIIVDELPMLNMPVETKQGELFG
ncbi:MAG TPA: 2'-5' RNA ligase family protein [Chitinophagaceae bacterium]